MPIYLRISEEQVCAQGQTSCIIHTPGKFNSILTYSLYLNWNLPAVEHLQNLDWSRSIQGVTFRLSRWLRSTGTSRPLFLDTSENSYNAVHFLGLECIDLVIPCEVLKPVFQFVFALIATHPSVVKVEKQSVSAVRSTHTHSLCVLIFWSLP